MQLLLALATYAVAAASACLLTELEARFANLSARHFALPLTPASLRANTLAPADNANAELSVGIVMQIVTTGQAPSSVQHRLSVLEGFITDNVPTVDLNNTVLPQARALFIAFAADSLGVQSPTTLWNAWDVDYRGLLLLLNLAYVIDFNNRAVRHSTLKVGVYSVVDPMEMIDRKGHVDPDNSTTPTPSASTGAPVGATSQPSVAGTSAPTHKPTKKPTKKKHGRLLAPGEDTPPETYDLRLMGAVGPVVDQGRCGSCWIFASTAVIEGSLVVQHGYPLSALAPQQFVSCVRNDSDLVCHGGYPNLVFEYASETALTSAAVVPYQEANWHADTGPNLTCTEIPQAYITDGIATVTAHSDFLTTDDEIQQALMDSGPVVIGVAASSVCFDHYAGGVLMEGECVCYDPLVKDLQIDHDITVVGWGVDVNTSVPYWIVRNSWGVNAGLKGYWLLERGVPYPGTCGMLTQAQSATVNPTEQCTGQQPEAFCTRAYVPLSYADVVMTNDTTTTCPYPTLAGYLASARCKDTPSSTDRPTHMPSQTINVPTTPAPSNGGGVLAAGASSATLLVVVVVAVVIQNL